MPELPRNLPHLICGKAGKRSRIQLSGAVYNKVAAARPSATPAGAGCARRSGETGSRRRRGRDCGRARKARAGHSYRHSGCLSRFRTPARIGRRSGTAGESSKIHRTRRGPAGIAARVPEVCLTEEETPQTNVMSLLNSPRNAPIEQRTRLNCRPVCPAPADSSTTIPVRSMQIP